MLCKMMTRYSGRFVAIRRMSVILLQSMHVSTSRSGPLLEVTYVALESLWVALLLMTFLMAVASRL